ncbi:type IV secretory system conjugative DNA transfer family protein [Mucilaginibacter sp.]|uniref:type IV secretory system conjugative DNA transfer family protein n=1 Tax=Mucilaginibacter sp. TaxID=1882438 RepID=UPI0035BC1167
MSNKNDKFGKGRNGKDKQFIPKNDWTPAVKSSIPPVNTSDKQPDSFIPPKTEPQQQHMPPPVQPPVTPPPPPINEPLAEEEPIVENSNEPNWRFHRDHSNDDQDRQEYDKQPDFGKEAAKKFARKFKITTDDLTRLIQFEKDPEKRNRRLVFLIGVFFTAVTLGGALWGFIRAYERFYKAKVLPVLFYPMSRITKVSMLIGAVLAWVLLVIVVLSAISFLAIAGFGSGVIISYFVINLFMTLFVFGAFTRWQNGINNSLIEGTKFGSARFARPDELEPLAANETGFYIGGGFKFNDKGHILTVAGTRGGKGTNLIIPNLLDAGGVETSFIVIDPKGENAAITARYQRESGKTVIILNPWDLLVLHVGEAKSYNPLDMLDVYSTHLIDDIQIIAEMIVPQNLGAKDSFWTDSARTIISGLLLHLVTTESKGKIVLKTLWEWARLPETDWNTLVAKMCTSNHVMHGNTIKNSGREILKLQAAGEETFGGIMSSVLQATDFLKSPALQKSLESGFDPKTLIEGKSTVYVIIPADKLRTHGRWLRLVVTSMMRSVIRKPGKRVTFLLDEFAALGYMPEIETALSTYAGYNITVWPILQSLIQLKNLYRDNWETFIANCTVRQYFTINDNFSADYISKAIGETTNMITTFLGGKRQDDTNKRLLVTPDELRRESGRKIFMFIGDLPPTFVNKRPYYHDELLNELADKNPYIL